MLEKFLSEPAAVERRRTGLFGCHLDSFIAAAAELGYTRATVRHRLWLLADFERWLRRKRLTVVDLDEQVVTKFLERRRRNGRLGRSDARTLDHLLEYLREKGAIESPTPTIDESPLARLHKQYENYLKKERGVLPLTTVRYWASVERFLVQRFGEGPIDLRELTPNDISEFILRHMRLGSSKTTQLTLTALRSFFRFLFRDGATECDLAGAVPGVPTWRLAEVPKYLKAEDVERVINACDRSTCVGCRDHGLILLLARLGLRAGEVVALELDDIDWRAGVLTVCGKGRSHDRLPLPSDVGRAIAIYLRQHRPPHCTTRRVFIRSRAPHRGFANSSSVSTIVCRALKRAGLQPDLKGAHLLRHSLATGMLRRGASLAEIGEILRHRTPNTTEIYAKVDVTGLRSLARPWPTKGGKP